MSQKWQTLSQRELFRTRFFTLKSESCRLPDGRTMDDYYSLEVGHWVNVLPVTEDGKVVLIEQYRHAAKKATIEIPGGMLDQPGEDPKRAALRELEEETGYVPAEIQLAAAHFPNPALQNNQMITFVAFGCRREREQNLDEFEDIGILEVSVSEMLSMVQDGRIDHSIVLASLFRALPFLGCQVT